MTDDTSARWDILNGDCREVLRSLPDASVDAVITDPPYPCIKRHYGYWSEDDWFALMDVVVPECRRVLKPQGSAMFVLQPNSERLGMLRPWLWRFLHEWSVEWNMVQDAWWWNTTAMPSDMHGLLRPSLKSCAWFGEPNCYRNQDEVLWDEAAASAQHRLTARAGRVVSPSGRDIDRHRMYSAAVTRGGVTPFNVLPVSNVDGVNSSGGHGHGAGTPLKLCDWWVRYICPPGGTVLDPFNGAGTCGVAAVQQGRRYIGIEVDGHWCDVSRQRIAEAETKQLRLLGVSGDGDPVSPNAQR